MPPIALLSHSEANSVTQNAFSEILTGRVLDSQAKPVTGAIIILCDQNSGIPVSKETYRPFTDEVMKGRQAMDLAYTTTDDKGRFTFKNISAGEYRLVAQSWKDTEQFKGVFEKNGKEIELHGVTEHIKVSSGNSPDVLLRPLGTGILQMNEDAPNDETLLVVSLSPTRADPILGFTGWGGAFMQNMIGGNRMPKGKTTIYGLPEGKVYLAMFAADSVPGWTQGQAEIKPDTTTVMKYIPFVNSWSNSRHDPPEHLVPVFEEVKQLSPQDRKFILNIYKEFGLDTQTSDGVWGFMAQLGPHLEKEVELPSGSKATFGEVTAAAQYVQLQRTMERKKEQWKKNDEAMNKFLDRRAAKKAMAQKEQVRIRETVDISSPSSFFPDDAQAGEELDELWAVKNHAFSTVSSEEIFEIVRKGFRRTTAKKDDIIGTIGNKFVWHMRPSVERAVDILYCASFEPDVKYNAFYYGLTVAKPKSPEVLKRLVDLAMQGYGVGRIAWGVQDQREEFINLIKPYLKSTDPEEKQQAQNIMRVIEGKSSRVYNTAIGETNPEDIAKVRKNYSDKLKQIKQTLLTGTSSLRHMELERICSLNICLLFDDTFIPVIQTCAKDGSPDVRIKTAEVAGYYWIWGDTIKNPKITRLLIQLSEDEVSEVRLTTVEKGLFNIPNKTEDVIKRMIDITLTDREEIPEKLYARIQYVLRVNKEKTQGILQEYLKDGEHDHGSVTSLYRDALRSDPPVVSLRKTVE